MSTENIFTTNSLKGPLPPGARVTVRGEDWLVKQCQFDNESNAYIVRVTGLSGIARDLEMTFLDTLDKIKIVDPLQIKFELDDSKNYRKSKLFLDSWLRKSVPTTNHLVIGHRGAFKEEKFQFTPAVMALDQSKTLRPRILMADAVGLGKTIQVGVLLTELMRRGKANRILVVGLKAMMGQLQKELWSRFSIPLKMMDSKKVENVYRDIPSGMNPFNYHDKIIISMDTLKTQENMRYLEGSHWDVIVIDECHNVAAKGKSTSIRSKLAKKLASASDSLILTSATPHDGTKESYASLLELIDPTLVVDPNEITKSTLEDSGVIIRRFRSSPEVKFDDVPDRSEMPIWLENDELEDNILENLKDKTFKVLDEKKSRKKDVFFRSTLAKTLFSSPEAFKSSVNERLKKLDSKKSEAHKEDYDFLTGLMKTMDKYNIKKTPKYKKLLKILKDEIGKKERVVIFSEFRRTQDALLLALSEDLGLKPQKEQNKFDDKAEVIGFNATVSEDDQQKIVEYFGLESSKIKIMVTSDIASEGVNLHFYCNHLIHYDVPWSFITLEQRNGRIDRYGQPKQPKIYYLVTDSKNPALEKFKERWVVEKLLSRSKLVQKQMGDVRLALNCFDPEKEEEKVTLAFQQTDKSIESLLFEDNFEEVFGSISTNKNVDLVPQPIEYIYSDQDYFEAACAQLKIKFQDEDNILEIEKDDDEDRFDQLTGSLSNLQSELNLKKITKLSFTHEVPELLSSIAAARKKSGLWPDKNYLWELHPVISGITKQIDNVLFEKDSVPIILIDKEEGLSGVTFLLYGAISNKQGQPLKSQMVAASLGQSEFSDAIPLLREIGFLKEKVINSTKEEKTLKQMKKYEKDFKSELAKVILNYEKSLSKIAVQEHKVRAPKLEEYSKKIKTWHGLKKTYLEGKLSSSHQKRRLEEELVGIEKTKNSFELYVRQQFEVELESPFVRPVAILVPDDGSWS